MVPAPPPSSSQPFPPHLKSHHPNPQTPWNFSEPLFKRVQNYTSDKSFKLCEVLNTDPELNFILKYFEHQKPPGYSIKRIVCIHNVDHTQVFEGTLKNQEREANNPFFAPKGKDEEPITDRVRVLSRWESQASQFSPVEINSLSSRGTDTCTKVKVLPLWHGSTKEVCQSICWSGFTSFGKHHYFDENASKGGTKSTDKGYFGAGIYFTNSAQYATMYSSGGNLLLSWVSMREPYPVVNDRPHPQKGSDMFKLEGRMHYQNYNAHFIPVASVRPHDPQCIEYYPCYKDQTPAWDEFVVFHNSQALPRFWIELGTDFPKVMLSDIGTAGELLTLLLTFLNKAEVQQHPDLVQKLRAKADLLLDQAETTPLGVEDQRFLKLAKRLLPEGEKLNTATVNMLIRAGSTPPRSPLVAAAVKVPPPAAAAVKTPAPSLSAASSVPSLPPVLAKMPMLKKKAPVKPALPTIAFGKELWAQYLGAVDEEPPLPSGIQQILQSPCPFFPGKKVEETHLLTLIPKTVNGQPLTLNSLEELVKHPKQGQATKYRIYRDKIKEQYGSQPPPRSYWVLMTRDVIPESQNKSYDVQEQLLASYSQKAHVPYEVPHLLETAVSVFMEYLKTGERLYSFNPSTYTRCQERLSIHPTWPLTVGGFSVDGLHVDCYDIVHVLNGMGGLRKFNQEEAKINKQLNIGANASPTSPAAALVKPSPQPISVGSSVPSLPPVLAKMPMLKKKAPVKPALPTIAFGKEQWAKYLGDVGEEPTLPADIHQILKSPCPFNPGQRVEETHLLTLIPKTVNGKPLTLNSLEELMKHPKQGKANEYAFYRDEIKKQYGTQPLPRSYWVLMTRDVIPRSRNKSYDAQKQLLESYSQKAHALYEVPQLLEATVSIFMEYLKTGQRLYNDLTRTRCQERVSGKLTCPLVVGSFAADGLIVNFNNGVIENDGVGGLRKFNGQNINQDDQKEATADMQLKLGATSPVTPNSASPQHPLPPVPSKSSAKALFSKIQPPLSVSLGEDEYQKALNFRKKGDLKQAFTSFQKAANQGHAAAQFNLGFCYEKGQGVTQDHKERVKWYQQAANQGHAAARVELGSYDYKEAVKWYQKEADQGDANAQFNLGFCYLNGRGVARDDKEAVKWYQKAANQGHAAAQLNLGHYYFHALDDKEAVKWYQKAAEQGYAEAQCRLGVCYTNGQGVTKDEKEAAKWYQKAAEQGHLGAQHDLGVCYTNGQGVTKDEKEAAKWYQKAAEQGNLAAQHDLGVCYTNGQGVTKDEKEAVKWYQKAAARGYSKAQEALKKLKTSD